MNDDGVKLPPRKVKEKTQIVVPDYLKKVLSTNKTASEGFEKLSPSHQREYIAWITEAKTAQTRERRMDKALQWIVEGKGRNWQYKPK